MGCGVRSARMLVALRPSRPHTTMRSPSCSTPFTRMTSIVVPRPSTTFTSSTVACSPPPHVSVRVLSCRHMRRAQYLEEVLGDDLLGELGLGELDEKGQQIGDA